jgi:flagellar secretion chaperone FliS
MGENIYFENQVLSASQDKLLIMLFEGAINFLKRINYIDFEKDIEIRNYNINKATAIINELQCTLNMEYEDISQPLYLLYDYMRNRLLEGNMNKKKEYIDEVISMLIELKESFQTVSAPKIENILQNKPNYAEETTSVCFNG